MADYVSITWPHGALSEAQTKTMLNVPVPAGVSLAASRLRQWVNRTNEERPTRDELRDDVETLLDERLRLVGQIEERRTLSTDMDTLLRRLDEANIRAEKYRTERDHWHDIARGRGECIEKLRESRDSARNLRDEYHEAYHAAENERNKLNRENAQLRSELAFAKESSALRGDALILRLRTAGDR